MMAWLPITPVAKPRMTQSDRWKLRPAVLRYRTYCDELRTALPDFVLPGELDLIFFIPMPASWSAGKRLLLRGAPHEQKPDIDNLCKALMDAFKTDDSHVWSLTASKYWSEIGGIEIGGGVEKVSDHGVLF